MNWIKFQENAIFRISNKRKSRKRWRNKPKGNKLILEKAAHYITPILVSRSKRMSHNPTKAELTFKEILRECGLSMLFKSQVILFHYIIDFFSSRLLLGIEIDGGYHKNLDQIKYDKHRERLLLKKGIKLIHFSNEQVFNQRESVKRILLDKFGRFSKLRKFRSPYENPKIYFSEEQTQEQLRALIPSEMARA